MVTSVIHAYSNTLKPKFSVNAQQVNEFSVIKSWHMIMMHDCITHIFPYSPTLLDWAPSVQFSRSVVSYSLQPHESRHARPPCPSQTPRGYSNPCPLSRWCHPAIPSSVVPFSSRPQSFQYQGLFQWVSSSHEVAKVLEFQLQHQSFQWTPRTDLL